MAAANDALLALELGEVEYKMKRYADAMDLDERRQAVERKGRELEEFKRAIQAYTCNVEDLDHDRRWHQSTHRELMQRRDTHHREFTSQANHIAASKIRALGRSHKEIEIQREEIARLKREKEAVLRRNGQMSRDVAALHERTEQDKQIVVAELRGLSRYPGHYPRRMARVGSRLDACQMVIDNSVLMLEQALALV
ncbi:hypothetical protein DIPPA_16781 [Diplonema papillatum]|nr:hypothetical protein DIPPA_16781 [Diplonema papillatum]